MERSQTRSRTPGEVPAEGLPERRDGPGAVIGAAAATLLVIVGLNNLGTTTGSGLGPELPIPRPSQRASALPLPGAVVRMPDLVGTTEPVASQVLHELGLLPRVIHRFVACYPAGRVVEQEPASGVPMSDGEPVTVVATDLTSEQLTCPDGIATDGDRSLANLLYGFSRGVAGARPPTARTLSLGMLGAAPTMQLTGPDAQNLERWRVSPPHGGTADSVPVLAFLVESGGEYRVDQGPHPLCVGPVRQPAPDLTGLSQVSITPTAERASCLGWWAVDLFLDEAGRIQGVNLDLWEP